jgi:hypothetical protein
MNTESRHRIITIAFAIVPVLIVVWLIQSPAGSAASVERQRLAGRLAGLERELSALGQQGRNYLDRAPREYDHYFRDVEIVYPNLMAHVDSVDASFASLALDAGAVSETELAPLIATWVDFRRGLDEQLGVDPAMPRLEWGARHVAERLPALSERLVAQRQRLSAESASRAGSGGLALLLALVTALAMSLWSLRTTTRRG